jgi:hypothetical protein
MRVDFQDAARHGAGVTEINRFGQAADDIRKLWGSITRLVKENTTAAADSESFGDYDSVIVEQYGRLDNMRVMSL